MPQVARCLWGGGFTSTLTIAGDLRNTPRTSPISSGFLSMTGEAGVVAPKILSAVLADPDNGDVVFSDGDTLTITFDSETNRAISRIEGYLDCHRLPLIGHECATSWAEGYDDEALP